MLSLIRTTAKIALPRQIHIAHCPRRGLLAGFPVIRPKTARAASSTANPPSGSASSSPPEVEPSSPAKDSSSNPPDSTSRSGKSVVGTPSNAPSIKRRVKRSIRASGRATAPTSEPSQVYVPSIPNSFLTTNYHGYHANKYRDAKLPYHINENILREFLNTTASCLLPKAPFNTHIQRMPARYNNILLSCLCEGSSQMLESLTLYAAAKVGANVVTVDMQDLMELTADIFNSKGAGNPWPVDSLSRGFNPFIAAAVPTEFVDDMIDDNFGDFRDRMDDDDDEDEDDDDERAAIIINSRILSGGHEVSKAAATAVNEKFSTFWTALFLTGPSGTQGEQIHDPPAKILYLKDIADIVSKPIGSIVLPTLVSTTINLRRAGHNVMVIAGHPPSLLSDKRQHDDEVADEIKNTAGTASMDLGTSGPVSLTAILQKLRSPDTTHRPLDDLPNGFPAMTYDMFPGPTQCLHHISIPPYIPPTMPPGPFSYAQLVESAHENKEMFKRDKTNRIKEINCRNLLAVLRYRGGFLAETETSESAFHTLPGIGSEVWGFIKVFRIISNAIGARYLSEVEEHGLMSKKAYLTHDNFQHGLTIANENAKLRNSISSRLIKGKKPIKPTLRVEEFDRYERRLLGSIVDPDHIKTTFKNTIIPRETIQTLQTMITLPLVRPQLFSYGLLQDEYLSGLLLFGPPGTGKTLLAKAVARESGARMLEIKASNIFDMYVGEGEKNVSAVFRLARRLSPCVIFLDEVDSIFGARARGGGAGIGGNSSQREILNQFMVEWDGLRSSGQNHGIVVMASTNRPFELDDAVLRRLPRRILVDLPSEEAREQILKVYLGKERLEESIDIKELAKKAEFYSGSDLKNLCVSATLACVREDVENEIMSLQPKEESSGAQCTVSDKVFDLSVLLEKHKKETLSPETAPSNEGVDSPVRVLRKRHFDKAFTQITPSCSENMESLTELRKWDGLYGDGGKGRRKTLRGIGFEVDPKDKQDVKNQVK